MPVMIIHYPLPKYDSPLTMASVMNNFFIDKTDNIRAEFPLLEANLPSYSFILMDSIMSMCPASLSLCIICTPFFTAQICGGKSGK